MKPMKTSQSFNPPKRKLSLKKWVLYSGLYRYSSTVSNDDRRSKKEVTLGSPTVSHTFLPQPRLFTVGFVPPLVTVKNGNEVLSRVDCRRERKRKWWGTRGYDWSARGLPSVPRKVRGQGMDVVPVLGSFTNQYTKTSLLFPVSFSPSPSSFSFGVFFLFLLSPTL